jgi:hypothetical protein
MPCQDAYTWTVGRSRRAEVAGGYGYYGHRPAGHIEKLNAVTDLPSAYRVDLYHGSDIAGHEAMVRIVDR